MKARMMIGLALVCMFGFAGLQTGQEYFQKALSKERAEGNLREAIVLYQKAIEASKDESLAAKAQLQIGLCYEKLGLQEAEKAFHLVVEKYPSQSETVKLAKERLERLSAAASPSAPVPGGLVLRKLDIPVGIPSPDGKFIASNVSGGDLFFYEIYNKRMTILKTSSSENGSFQYGVSWSPDSKQFAYIWSSSKIRNGLYIWTIGAAEPNLLCSDLHSQFGNIAGWTPDKNWIFIQYRSNSSPNVFSKGLGRISVLSGAFEKICDIDKSQFNMRLSPDGKYLAYNVDAASQDHEIRIMTADGKDMPFILKHEGEERFMQWNPDGRSILFSSDRVGQSGLWIQEIEKGHALGEPSLINSFGQNIDVLGVINTGALFIKTTEEGRDAYTAEIDLLSGKTVRSPTKIETVAQGWTSTPIWSADGRILIYFLRKKGNPNTFYYDTIRVRSEEATKFKEYSLNFRAYPEARTLPHISRDKKAIFLIGEKGGVRGLIKFDLIKGEGEFQSQESGIQDYSSDGNIAYFVRSSERKPGDLVKMPRDLRLSLIRKDLLSGTEKVIYQGDSGEGFIMPQLSPDGDMVGIYSIEIMKPDSAGIFIIPSDPKATMNRNSSLFIKGLPLYSWGPSGKGLLISRWDSVENRKAVKLFYLPTINPASNPIPIELDIERAGISFHPDGKTIAYTRYSDRSAFWMLENMLPKK